MSSVFVSFTNLQISSDGFFSLRLGAGQLLPQHLLPHVDGLQRLLDVEEVLLEETERQEHVLFWPRLEPEIVKPPPKTLRVESIQSFTNLTLGFSAAPQCYSISEVIRDDVFHIYNIYISSDQTGSERNKVEFLGSFLFLQRAT